MQPVGKVRMRTIIDRLQYQMITGNDEALNRWTIVPDVNRPGLELAGYFKPSETRRITIIGEKEMDYMMGLEYDVLMSRFDQILDEYTPCIIFAHNQKCPEDIRNMAIHRNFPIFETSLPTYRVMVEVVALLDELMAQTETFHGGLMNVYGKGVLIMGESGMGKSEIALELIRKGHILIADDRVDIARIHNQLIGKSPDLLKGMLEIRGIGIIDVARMFGGSSILGEFDVDLVIRLEKFDDLAEYTRVGVEEQQYLDILGVHVPQMIIPVKEGRNMAVLVESAVTNFQLKARGFDSAKEFERRVYEFIEEQNRNPQQED